MTFIEDLKTAVEDLDIELVLTAAAGGQERIDTDKTLAVVVFWTGVSGLPSSQSWYRTWRLDVYGPTIEQVDEPGFVTHATDLVTAVRTIAVTQSVVRGSDRKDGSRYFFIALAELDIF